MNNQRMFTVLLRGGLGNQLFQYFSARELAIDSSASLVLDARLLPSETRHSDNRPSEFSEEVSSFLHDGVVINSDATGSLPKRFVRFFEARVAQYARRLARNQVQDLGSFIHLSGDLPLPRKPTFTSDRDVFLNHLFLNPTSFRYAKDGSVRALEFIASPTPWFVIQKKNICERRPLAIHHRLGDHVRLGSPANLDYITRALGYLDTVFPCDVITVFTDDIPVSREILSGLPYKLEYIEPPPESRPIESLVLMSNCRALVMSRSSFSWWAATLGGHSGLTPVLNREWLGAPSTPEFLNEIPDSWVIL